MNSILTSRPMTDVLHGLVLGVVFGLVALGLVLIWRATRVLNFALGAIATAGAYAGLALLSYGVGFWWCALLALPAGMLLGAVSEFFLIRPLYGKPEINPIVAMVGLLYLLESLIGAVWGTGQREIPQPFSFVNWHAGGNPVGLSPVGLFQIVAALAIATGIWLLFRFTNVGLQLRAAAVAPEVSRLLGVRVGRMRTLGWAIACGVAAAGTVIIVSAGPFSANPLVPTAMESPFAVGFIAAAVGGLDSPFGGLLAGIGLGVAQEFVVDYWNPNMAIIFPLLLLVLVLLLRPQGLFARTTLRRV